MEVFAVTLFFSLLLAALFAVLFFVNRADGKSVEQQSLLPLEEERRRPAKSGTPGSRR